MPGSRQRTADGAADDVELAARDGDDGGGSDDDDDEREMIKKKREPDTRKGYARKYKHFRRFAVVNRRQQTLADQPAQLDRPEHCM